MNCVKFKCENKNIQYPTVKGTLPIPQSTPQPTNMAAADYNTAY